MSVLKYRDPNTGEVKKVGFPTIDTYSKEEISNLVDTHANNKSNPHNVTAAQIGAMPTVTGAEGQVVGFDADGNPVAQDAASSSAVYTAVIGTTWIENSDTGVKSQTVSISGVTASQTAKVDVYFSGTADSDGYAAFVEQQNQFLDYITNGYAETVADGITFYIFGDPNTVEIPIVVEVG